MKKSDAKPGTKVVASYGPAFDDACYDDGTDIILYRFNEDDHGDLVGVIRSEEAAPGNVKVKWIDGMYLDDVEEEMEVPLSLLTLESDRASIEAAYKNVSKEIREKMKEAGKLVKEANSMAKKAKLGPLADLYDAVSPLVDAMDNSGWRSSSWGC